MRIKINFEPSSEFSIHVNYNHILQALIYSYITPQLARSLHDEGYVHGKRRFKLFTFSRLLVENGRFRFDSRNNRLTTSSPVYFVISSPVENLIKEFASSMARESEVRIGNNNLRINSIDVYKQPELGEVEEYRLLSPVTVYSTLLKPDGSKKTYYYNPSEREFGQQIKDNLIKKFTVLNPDKEEFAKKLSLGAVIIEPLARRASRNEQIVKYKNTIIKGYLGPVRITANPILQQIAYDAGIGAKGSMGFGCLETYKHIKENL